MFGEFFVFFQSFTTTTTTREREREVERKLSHAYYITHIAV
jgi:hypothetical protein